MLAMWPPLLLPVFSVIFCNDNSKYVKKIVVTCFIVGPFSGLKLFSLSRTVAEAECAVFLRYML